MSLCRLCLKDEANGVSNPEETLKALQTFLPHMSRTVINTPIICEICYDNVKTAEKFLKRIDETNSKIAKELKRLKVTTINLRGFHKNTSNGISVCRTCLKLINRPRVFLCENNVNILCHDYISNMLKFCNITVNIEVSEKPVMCIKCWEALQITYSFKKEYLEVERKIREYCQEFRLRTRNLCQLTLQKVKNYFSDEYCEIVASNVKPDVKTENVFKYIQCPGVKKENAKMRVNKKGKKVKSEYRYVKNEDAELPDANNVPPKVIKFSKNHNEVLLQVYYEVTQCEQNFSSGYWNKISERWAELMPQKPIAIEKLSTQIQRVLAKNLLSTAELNRIKREVAEKQKRQIQNEVQCQTPEPEPSSDSEGSFVEVVHTPYIKPEPSEYLNEIDIEFNSLDMKLEAESDSESLPELERMDIPALDFRIEDICSLEVKREAYDNYMRQEDSYVSNGTDDFKNKREGLRDKRSETFKCTECNFETKFRGCWNRHAILHEKGNKTFHQCSKCPYRISNKWLFSRHMKKHKEEEKEDDEIPFLLPSAYPLY